MIFDCSIVFLLSYSSTRLIGYVALLFFHGVTGGLFQIGIFPLVMTGMVLVFFSNSWHNRLLSWLGEVKRPALLPFCFVALDVRGTLRSPRVLLVLFVFVLLSYRLQHRSLARQVFPAFHNHVTIRWADFHSVAFAVELLGGD
jgi:hypothetical protein